MTSLQNYVGGAWNAGEGDPISLYNPSTEAVLGDVRPKGVDFAAVMQQIRDEAEHHPESVTSAPHSMPVRRLDDVKAARKLDLRWQSPEES